MYLRLKNCDRTFKIDVAPTERTLRGADKDYWVISLSIKEHLTTDEVEEHFKPENATEMTFITPLPNGTNYEYTVTGYTNRIFNLIKHSEDGGCVVDLQFSKETFESISV
ncbi:MAG: hypothetical protein IIW54_12735 [Lachnospiraceae bacterium]|nr:hypothetical protein [Lachnospiraceae bacterium]